MADQPAPPGRKIKPLTVALVVGGVAAAGYLFLRFRRGGQAQPGAGMAADGASYMSGPSWWASWIRDQQGEPTPHRKRRKKQEAQ